MDLTGSGARMSAARWHPVAACEPLLTPVPSNRAGLDPPNIKLEAWIWRPCGWMPGC